MFSIKNFISPINSDIVLKICNMRGDVVFIIKDPTCTLFIKENTINVKQKYEGILITLEFNPTDIVTAHNLLRNALIQLQNNQTATSSNINILQYDMIAPTTIVNIDYDIVINISMNKILNIAVNGLVINKDQYTFTNIPPVIKWLGTADYILEPTDILTIFYI